MLLHKLSTFNCVSRFSKRRSNDFLSLQLRCKSTVCCFLDSLPPRIWKKELRACLYARPYVRIQLANDTSRLSAAWQRLEENCSATARHRRLRWAVWVPVAVARRKSATMLEWPAHCCASLRRELQTQTSLSSTRLPCMYTIDSSMLVVVV